MSCRLVLAALLLVMGEACGGDPAPAPVTPAPPAASASPAAAPEGDGGSGEGPDAGKPGRQGKTPADYHRDFLSGCARRSVNTPDYCECAWGEFRKTFSDVEMTATQLPPDKLQQVKAQVTGSCASLLPEDAVRADFGKACSAGRRELDPYCDCSWAELRKKLSAAELADEATMTGERFRAARATATKACAPKKPEGVSREIFLRACTRDPADDRYCGCVWKELRKQASPAEIEAGTFAQTTLFSQFEKTCGKLRAVKTAP